MEECLYCGDHSQENLFSLRAWANGGYCSFECLAKDINKHEQLIEMYRNDVYFMDKKISYAESEEEVDELEEKRVMYLGKQLDLQQKLPFMKTLLVEKKFRYREYK